MICKYCKEVKAAADFFSNNKSRCKACCNIFQLEWKRKNPEKHRVLTARTREGRKDKQNEYYKAWYLKNGRNRDKKKQLAHSMVMLAVRSGELIRPEICTDCKNPNKIEGHHNDYNKPLEVIWLCNRCHRKLHTGY